MEDEMDRAHSTNDEERCMWIIGGIARKKETIRKTMA
jgi:hypothetical protein